MQRQFYGWRCWMYVLPVREFKCPHCFEVFTRPIELIGQLPVISSFVGQSSPLKDVVSRSRSRRSRSQSSLEPGRRISRSLANFGKKVNRMEQGAFAGFVGLVRFLNPFRWFSKSSGRSRPRSMKSTDEPPVD
jgi:hypothetical protein